MLFLAFLIKEETFRDYAMSHLLENLTQRREGY